MEKTLAENSVKKEYSRRKKFAAAKRALGEAHCDDQESSHELQKRLKLSNQKYYDAIRAMREGREVGHNGRPSYLLPPEKVQFWSWVEERMRSGGFPLLPQDAKIWFPHRQVQVTLPVEETRTCVS